jgi:hypothetical protein
MRVLPEHHGGASYEEQSRGKPIARAPAVSGQQRFELDRFGRAHGESQAEIACLPLNPLIFAARDWLRKPTQPLPALGSRSSRKIFCSILAPLNYLFSGNFGYFWTIFSLEVRLLEGLCCLSGISFRCTGPATAESMQKE